MHFKLLLSDPSDPNGFSLGRIDVVSSKLESRRGEERPPRNYMVFVELTAVADFLRNRTVNGTPGKYELPNGDVIDFNPSAHRVVFEIGGKLVNAPTDVALNEVDFMLGKSAEMLSKADPLDPVLDDMAALMRTRN